MVQNFLIGAVAGAGYLLGEMFIPTIGASQGLPNKAANLMAAGVFGVLAHKFIK